MDDVLFFAFTDIPTVVTIKPTDPFFGTDGCATGTADLSALTASPIAPLGDGTWILGTDIAAGPGSVGAAGMHLRRLSTFAGASIRSST